MMPLQAELEGRKSNRVTTACRDCRVRKVRCSGGNPCKDCTRRGKDCVYLPLQKRRKIKDSTVTGAIEDRLARMEANLQGMFPPRSDTEESVQSHFLAVGNIDEISPDISQVSPRAISDSLAFSRTHNGPAPNATRIYPNCQDLESRETGFGDPLLAFTGVVEDSMESSLEIHTDLGLAFTKAGDSANTLHDSKSEHHEPWSWMSICSKAGSDWVCKRTKNRDFISIADRFASSLGRSFDYEEALSPNTRCFEADETDAWEFFNAFFEDCWEAGLGIVHRADIEARLRVHFSNTSSRNDDPAWFALRNTIYAGGFRSILAKSPSVAFSAAQSKAWKYFKNALSVFAKLLMPPSSLVAIQALTLMACYIEGLGNPGLQHLLCSNAVHAAQTKGLHRQPEKSWRLSTDDVVKRNMLWWVIYILEKHLALSSGRPSAVDDGNITAQVPSTLPQGSNIDLQTIVVGVRHAQICSQISRNIMSVKSIQARTSDLIDSVNELQRQLTQLLADMPDHFRMGTLARLMSDSVTSPGLTRRLHLHFAIYGSLMALHTHFFYPWMSSRFATEQEHSLLEKQISLSATAVAEAARQILLALRMVTTNATTPSWLALYCPLYAHINLFVYILNYPTLATTKADMGLLDVCVGHFGYLEFLNATELSISFPRETASLATKAVKAAETEVSSAMMSLVDGGIASYALEDQPQSDIVNTDMMNSTVMGEVGDLLEFDSGAWNFFSSFDMMGAGAIIQYDQ